MPLRLVRSPQRRLQRPRNAGLRTFVRPQPLRKDPRMNASLLTRLLDAFALCAAACAVLALLAAQQAA